jgi:DNA uptake protein ComE-like DNA-binding protein
MTTLAAFVVLTMVAQAPIAPVPAHAASPPQAAPFTFEMRDLTEEESAALPPGAGRDAVASMCVPCHGVLPAVALRKTALGWAATVEDMRTKGAKGTDEQAAAAAAYLSSHFAAVDVNTASAHELVKIADLSLEDAAAIVAFRGDGHPFKSYTDVKKVPGVDPKRLAAAKGRFAYAPK